MATRIFCSIIIGIAACFHYGESRCDAPKPAKQEKTDAEKIVGIWQVGSAENENGKSKDEDVALLKVAFTGKQYMASSPAIVIPGEYLIDSSKSPKRLDIYMYDGPKKGKTDECIYELDVDTLRVCIKEGSRPEEMSVEKGTGRSIITLKRITRPDK